VRCGELIGSTPAPGADGGVLVAAALDSDAGALVSVTSDGQIAWRHRLTTFVHASPGVFADSGVAIAADNAGCVVGVDIRSGERRWSYRTMSGVKGPIVVDPNGRCLLGSFAGYLHCLDTSSGALHWARKLSHRFFAAPAVVGGYAVVGGSTHLVAVEIATGTVRWWQPVGGKIRGTPALLGDGSFAVGCGDGTTLVCDVGTGAVRYAIGGSGPVLSSLAASRDGLVVASAADGLVFAFRHPVADQLARAAPRAG
jgi:outer membrane protein assembly factor BamB